MSREWIYARAAARASKKADRCANTAATRILYLREEAVFTKKKKLVLNQATAVGLPGQFDTVWKIEPHTHTHTRTCTHNHCIPEAYAPEG